MMIANLTAVDGMGSVGVLAMIFFWVILATVLATAVAFVFSLIDLFKYSDASWLAARQNKVLMLLLILLVPFVGVLVYMVASRPTLRRAQAELARV